jgi:hypothetical protein
VPPQVGQRRDGVPVQLQHTTQREWVTVVEAWQQHTRRRRSMTGESGGRTRDAQARPDQEQQFSRPSTVTQHRRYQAGAKAANKVERQKGGGPRPEHEKQQTEAKRFTLSTISPGSTDHSGTGDSANSAVTITRGTCQNDRSQSDRRTEHLTAAGLFARQQASQTRGLRSRTSTWTRRTANRQSAAQDRRNRAGTQGSTLPGKGLNKTKQEQGREWRT